jgi:hypothetical protein
MADRQLLRHIAAVRHFGAGSSEANDPNRSSNYANTTWMT